MTVKSSIVQYNSDFPQQSCGLPVLRFYVNLEKLSRELECFAVMF